MRPSPPLSHSLVYLLSLVITGNRSFFDDNNEIELRNFQPGAASAPGFVTSLSRYRRLPSLRLLACQALIKGFGCG